jgi:hypothetical protein
MTEGIRTLDELLSDPVVQMVMARDGVRPQELRWMLERARDRAGNPSLPPAYMVAESCRARLASL